MVLDPITGLPADALGSDLFQIPLNTKPVPLEDWQAQGRQGSFLYPDNIPPVMATVAAQHPDTSNAQSLHTDGKHALLVKDVGAGAGVTGGTNTPLSVVTYDYSQSTGGFGTSELGHDMPQGTVIYGISFSWTYDAGNVYAHANAKILVFIETADANSAMLVLAAIGISSPASGNSVQYTGNVNRMFGPGIVPKNPSNTVPGFYRLMLNEVNIGGGDMTCNIWCDR